MTVVFVISLAIMKIVKLNFLVILFFAYQSIYAQLKVEFSYGIGPNATFAKTIKSNNMTWGYATPPLPHMGTQQLNIGLGTAKNKFYFNYDWGEFGPDVHIVTYPIKHPLDDTPNIGSNMTNFSRVTSIKGRSWNASDLSQFSIQCKHLWLEKNKFQHQSIVGVGLLKTRTAAGGGNFGSGQYLDSLGYVEHGFIVEPYHYMRIYNIYLTIGYQLSYTLNPHWKINSQIMFNQGILKMIWWHSYRYYSESLTGYTEFDEQWSFTRLSYISLLSGFSYELFRDKPKKSKL
jgi:hypothetical protein